MTNFGISFTKARSSIHSFVWVAMIALSAAILFPRLDQNALVDFRSSWSAARLLCSGHNPYDDRSLLVNERAAGWTQQKAVIPWNPPWAFSVIIPFALLPFGYAKWAWLAVNGLLMLFLGDYWWRSYGGIPRHRMASWLASLWFFPCIVALYFGQMSLLVLAGVTGIIWSLEKGNLEWLGGFTLLASLKPHLLVPMWILFILWIIRQKLWKVIIRATSGIALAGIIVAWLRPGIYYDYMKGVASPHGPTIWATPTIGTALRIAFPGKPEWIFLLPCLFGMLFSLILWRKWRTGFAWERNLDFILLLSLSTAIYAWVFDWAILLPVAIRILTWLQSNPGRQWPTTFGLVCVMGIFVWVQARGLFPLGAVWFPWGLALVYGWARWRQGRISSSFMRVQPS
jgi:hypothetical protein